MSYGRKTHNSFIFHGLNQPFGDVRSQLENLFYRLGQNEQSWKL